MDHESCTRNLQLAYEKLKQAQKDYWNNTYYDDQGNRCVFGGQKLEVLESAIDKAQADLDSAYRCFLEYKKSKSSSITIKRYQLKPAVTFDWLTASSSMKAGGSWIHQDATVYESRLGVVRNIDIEIAFPEDLSKWNDFDYVLVLDDDFCQPYAPFYNYIDGDVKIFDFLEKVINEYHNFMDSRWYLEEITSNGVD